MKLNIISPEKRLFEGEIERVNLPGTLGSFTILTHHAPIVSSLRQGTIVYLPMGGEEQSLVIKGGFVEMSDEVVDVCVEV